MVQFHQISMINPFNSLIYMMLFISTLFAVSSTNWLFIWIMLELNLLSFIPLITTSSTFQETEASVKYFLIQALGSSLLLIARLTLIFNPFPTLIRYIIIALSLSLKIGLAPVHIWYPSVITSISWINCFLLSTWQKLAPLLYLTIIISQNIKYIFFILATSSALLGGLLGINQRKLRAIIAYSSITHLGWIISLMLYKPLITIIYFTLYSIIILPLFIIFHITSLFSISNNSFKININYKIQIIVPLLLLSLRGIPPLTGFIPKWMTILFLAETNPLLLIILIIGSLIRTYYYLSLIFTSLINFTINIKMLPNVSFHYSKFIIALTSTRMLILVPFLVLL